ncbi:hypothetical protein F511_34978 [Dorcoceras hygrometricum]|uniref:Uncharacterized protein n=1 Tax=Dorcoceras hygrometricum TaxID=472368 RepID=A0A2Z7AYT6_9LAMI|nr:hypothetical protein F511_34978 [Dorcoceras hygrometricum]
MVNMFKALEASGLRGFLGCPSVLYEQELEQFFDTAIVQDGDISCAVSGKYVEISESRFAGVFNLPTDGLSDLSEVPNQLVMKARTVFARLDMPVPYSCKKRLLKYEFRLLNDILAKSITVKAGSFDAVTHERFLMRTTTHFGVRINWSKILFEVLKEMADRTIKRAKGFAAQICVFLKGDPAVTLGEAMWRPNPTGPRDLGLRGFLGCPSVLYKQELEQFFDTNIVQDGDITCAVSGKYVKISESRFAGVFNLSTDGLSDLSEVPNHLVMQARTVFARLDTPVPYSCKKRLLKYEFRLLNDFLAKSITVKAGSFDAVTHERFLMMTAIHFGVRINWSKILFEVLKDMADRTIKRSKGFADQICVLPKGNPAVTLGEAKTFPPLKILSAKTVNTYISTNKTIDARGDADEPAVAKVVIIKKKAVSKKRPAVAYDAPSVKKTDKIWENCPKGGGFGTYYCSTRSCASPDHCTFFSCAS